MKRDAGGIVPRNLAILGIFVIILVTSCLKPDHDPSKVESIWGKSEIKNSNFEYVGEVKAFEVNLIRKNNHWKKITGRQFSYSIRLRDKSTGKDVSQGHQFIIEDPVTGTQYTGKIKTANGELVWQENPVELNVFTSAKYIENVRYISSVDNGVYKGQLPIVFAINPWFGIMDRNEGTLFMDLNSGKLINSQKFVSKADSLKALKGEGFSSGSIPLKMDQFSLTMTQAQDLGSRGINVDVHLDFIPKVSVIDLDTEKFSTLSQGAFHFEMWLVNSVLTKNKKGEDEVKNLLWAHYSSGKAIPFDHGRFEESGIRIHLPERATLGQIKAYVRLIPDKGIEEIKPFEGIYVFEDLPNAMIDRKKSGYLHTQLNNFKQSDFSLQNYLEKINDVSKEERKKYGLLSGSRLKFDKISVKFKEILDETATQRTIKYILDSNVKYAYSGKSMDDGDFFEVYRLDYVSEFVVDSECLKQKVRSGKKAGDLEVKNACVKKESRINEVKLENENLLSGNLIWYDDLSHIYYSPEKYFKKKYKIVDKLNKVEYIQIVHINPWDYGFTVGFDDRSTPESTQREVVDSKIFISEFRYETIRFRYEIDSSLNLKVKKTILLRIDPKVLRYSSLTRGRNATEYLRDGIYLLKVAIQKNYYDGTRSGVQVTKLSEDDCFRNNKELFLRSPEEVYKKCDHYAGIKIDKNVNSKPIEYISAVKKLVRVQYGKIVTPLEFTVSDLRLMRIRTNFAIQLEAIDEKKLKVSPSIMLTDVSPENVNTQMKEVRNEYFNERLLDELVRTDNPQSEFSSIDTYSEVVHYSLKIQGSPIGAWAFGEEDELSMKEMDDNEFNVKTIDKLEFAFNKILSPIKNQQMGSPEHLVMQIPQYSEDKFSIPFGSWMFGAKEVFDPKLLVGLQKYEQNIDAIIEGGELEKIEYSNGDRSEVLYKRTKRGDKVRTFHNNKVYNLDQFIDTKAQLPTRTFIGPLIFLANSWSAGLRPTNELTESVCHTIDCTVLRNEEVIPEYDSDPEISKYFGSYEHFVDEYSSVDAMIKRLEDLKIQEKQEIDYSALLANYIRENNLDYISLTDRPIKYIDNYSFDDESGICEGQDVNKCVSTIYNSQLSYDIFKNWLNFQGQEYLNVTNESEGWGRNSLMNTIRYLGDQFESAVDKDFFFKEEEIEESKVSDDDIQNFILNQQFSHKLNKRLCYYFVYHNLGEVFSDMAFEGKKKWMNKNKGYLDHLFRECTYRGAKSPYNVFSVVRHFRVSEIGDYYFLGGKSMNFNVGADLNFSFGEDMSWAISQNPQKFFEKLSGMVGTKSKKTPSKSGSYVEMLLEQLLQTNGAMALPNPTSNLKGGKSIATKATGMLLAGLGKIMGAFNGYINFSINSGTKNGYTHGSSVSSSTYLAMQQADMNIDFKKYERCISVRPKIDFFEKFDFSKRFLKRKDFDKLINVAHRGIFLCEGQDVQENITKTETYYYFTQHFTQGDMLDDGDILNHPWLLALRGERDYVKFIDQLKLTKPGRHNAITSNSDCDEDRYPSGCGEDLFGFAALKYGLDPVTGIFSNRFYNKRPLMDIARTMTTTDISHDPFDILIDVYSDVTPTLPGLYTFASERQKFPQGNDALMDQDIPVEVKELKEELRK